VFCRRQLGKLSQIEDELDSRGVGLAAISVDTAERSAEMIEDVGITISLLSDPEMQVISAYGVADDQEPFAVPSTFVVRRDRTIHWHYVGETLLDRSDCSELLEIAERAKD
jgi:peroxiredoxin